ncbi:MAG: hypothetical protein HUJ98_12420, partial [Bacteroidaceae bacterium]|nr:hypothetical protein [Bacteroidaceae bacterium]
AQHTEITVFQNKLYLVEDKQLYSSSDGVEWMTETADSDISHLLGCNSSRLFAVHNGQFLSSTDAHYWDIEESEYPDLIPDGNIYSFSHPTATNSKIERTVLLGQLSNSTDSIAPVWYRQGEDAWTYMYTSADKSYFLPNLKNLVALNYKNYLIAFGLERQNSRYPSEPLSGIYVSLDNGLTWKQQEDEDNFIYPTLCDELKGMDLPFAAYVDEEWNIWILFSVTGEVWRGKLNFVDFASK